MIAYAEAVGSDSVAQALRAALRSRTGAPPRDLTVHWVGEIEPGRDRYEVSWRDDARPILRRLEVVSSLDGSAQRGFAAQRVLWRAGFDGLGGLAVAEPIALVPALLARVDGEIVGEPLSPKSGDGASAGRWLAALHTTQVGGSVRLPKDEIISLERAAWSISGTCRGAGERTRRLVEGLARKLERTGLKRPLVPTHGRYRPESVYVTSRRVTVANLEAIALSEPERDLGHMLAANLGSALRRRCSFADAARFNESFLVGYRGAGGTGSLGRLSLWTAIALLHELVAARPSGDHVDGWLGICERGAA